MVKIKKLLLLAMLITTLYLTSCDDEKKITNVEPQYGEITYVWNEDYSECTATRKCITDDTLTITETIKAAILESPANCDNGGSLIYQANFEYDLFQTQNYVVATPKLEHQYNDEEWQYITPEGHSHKCSLCHVHNTIEPHVGSGTATFTTSNICIKCGFVLNKASQMIEIIENKEYRYENGNIIYWNFKWKNYLNQVLESFNEYEYDNDLCVKMSSKVLNEANELQYKSIRIFEYNEANICNSDTYEMYDASGELESRTVKIDNKVSIQYSKRYNSDNNTIVKTNTEYDERENLIMIHTISNALNSDYFYSRKVEYEYDNLNNKIKEIITTDSSNENFKAYTIVEYEYNSLNEVIKHTSIEYDTDKDSLLESKYVYEYDHLIYKLFLGVGEFGDKSYVEINYTYDVNWNCIKEETVTRDLLANLEHINIKEKEYDSNGNCIKIIYTDYKTQTEIKTQTITIKQYDENGSCISSSEKIYDKDGNIIG